MKKNYAELVAAGMLLTIFLSGCAQYMPAKNSQESSDRVKIETGYFQCPECNKVVTYSSSIINFSRRILKDGQDGWITGQASIVLTNNNILNEQEFLLKINFWNSGSFINNRYTVITGLAPASSPLTYVDDSRDRRFNPNAKCSSSIGSYCGFDAYYRLPARLMEDVLSNGSPLKLTTGIYKKLVTNNGFERVAEPELYGVKFEIPSYVVAGFIDKIRSEHVKMPLN
jgi:hypothetical protein